MSYAASHGAGFRGGLDAEEICEFKPLPLFAAKTPGRDVNCCANAENTENAETQKIF
jgi:hypothetical protein